MLPRSLRQIFIGLYAPLGAMKFLMGNKNLFFIAVLPHVLTVWLYFWFVKSVFLAKWMHPLFLSLSQNGQHSFLLWLLQSHFVDVFVWLIAILLYGFLGTSFVNAVASPLYDIIARRAFEDASQEKLPGQSFMDFVDSMVSEITKAIIVFCVFFISFFLAVLAPLFFLAGIWYLGWNTADRTLLLMNLPLKERISFGFRNFGMCIGLGIWNYIPVLSTLMAFALAAGGGIAVAETDEFKRFQNDSQGAGFQE